MNSPERVSVQPQVIPAALKAIHRWVSWRYTFENGWKKPPICPRTGVLASVIDEASWSDFDTAIAFASVNRLDGIGIVLTTKDNLVGMDLDHCRDKNTGRIEDWALEIIQVMDSYTEVSPSGTGVRLFLLGDLPGKQGMKRGRIEVYGSGRYCTVTGHHVPGTPTTVEPRQTELLRFIDLHWPTDSSEPLPSSCTGPTKLADDQVIELASNCKNGAKFRRLMAGDWSEYKSRSEADLALCSYLRFWGGRDAPRIERLFGGSKLAEGDKWDSREDYRTRTILNSMAGGVFSPCQQVSTRIIQDHTGLIDTVGGEENLPTDNDDERAVFLAVEQVLAEDHQDFADEQRMFFLARKVRSRLAGKAYMALIKKAVIAFCKRADCPERAEDYLLAFCDYLPKVRICEGEDPGQWAFNMSGLRPTMTPKDPFEMKTARIASMAYHLFDLRKRKPFWFPVKKMETLFEEVSYRTIYRIIHKLEHELNVIRCVDADYSFTKGKAKEYIYGSSGFAVGEKVG